MAFDFVSSDTAKTYSSAESTRRQRLTLLWGDRVEVLDHDNNRNRTSVRARGYPNARGSGPDELWVNDDDLGGTALLDLYFIDVGQGDSVLVVTPDSRHILIDGGYPRRANPTGKSAADFVDWKFTTEYGEQAIALDAMIASHCDWDHYGGLSDLLDPAEVFIGPSLEGELDANNVTVERFYHAGLSRWTIDSDRSLGRQEPAADGDGEVIVDLLGNRNALLDHLDGDLEPPLQGEWKAFLERVRGAKRTSGAPTGVTRLDSTDGHLPGWTPSQGAGVTIHVLAPIVAQSEHGNPGLRDLGSDSINSNGHSLLLRLDYGSARILLTGDLNKQAQEQLLTDMGGGQWHELSADVAKACHHGSDKIAFEFLAAIRAGATIISSGDNEGHGHPRPTAVAASAMTGHTEFKNGELVTPLIYSTEIARSVRIGTVTNFEHRADPASAPTSVAGEELESAWIDYEETKSGDLHPTSGRRRWGDTKIVPGILYGLVNVRTDGSKILCATRSEKDLDWEVATFDTRFGH